MQTDYQNRHYNINQKDERTKDDRGRDGGTNFILRIKEQETRLTLQEHDDDYYYYYDILVQFSSSQIKSALYIKRKSNCIHLREHYF